MKPAKRNLLLSLLIVASYAYADGDPVPVPATSEAPLSGSYINTDAIMRAAMNFNHEDQVFPGITNILNKTNFSATGAPVSGIGAVNYSNFTSPPGFGDPLLYSATGEYDPTTLFSPLKRRGSITISARDFLSTTSFLPRSLNGMQYELTVEPVSCGPNDITGDLSQIADITDWTRCYSDRRTNAENPNYSDQTLLYEDQRICQCLRNSRFEAVANIMKDNAVVNRTYRSISSTYNQRVSERWNQPNSPLNETMNNVLDGLMFQSLNILKDNDLMGAYSSNLFVETPNSPNIQMRPDGSFALNLKREPDAKLVTAEEEYAPGQCLSPRDFIAMRQFPRGEDLDFILEDLTKPFDVNAFNYNRLEEEYREMMSRPVAERAQTENRLKIKKLKAKLRFLNRNPLIKYVMGAEKVGVAENSAKLDPEARDRVTDGVNETNYLEEKTRLFNIMKTLTRPECKNIFACKDDYQDSLKDFFEREEAMLMTKLEAQKDIEKKVRRQIDQTNYFESTGARPPVTSRSVLDEFLARYNLPAPSTCDPSITSDDARKCLDIYAGYCRTLDEVAPNPAEANPEDREIADTLDEELKDDFNPDYATNEEFQRENDRFCNQRNNAFFRRNVSILEFVENECRKRSAQHCPARTEEDWRHFRRKYHSTREIKDAYERMLAGVDGEHGNGGSQTIDKNDFNAVVAASSGNPLRSYDRFAERERTFNAQAFRDPATTEETPAYSQGTTSNYNRSTTREDFQPESFYNYSTLDSSQTTVASQAQNTTEPQRVQDMDQSRRQEMLEDWEREYNIWKERYGSDKSPATASQDAQYRTEISTLRALLDQQRQISEQQYQLLNDAIAARTRIEQQNLAQTEERNRERRERVDSTSRLFESSSAAVTGDDGVNRGPASIADQSRNISGNGGGGSSFGGASVGGGAGGSAAVSGSASADSVAREQAKLDNIRTFDDGSIIISSRSSTAQPNAITVTVSGEEMSLIRTNPDRIINQVQRDVTAEQLAELQQNGEVTVLVRTPNPNDPVYRMKLTKVNEKLVVRYDQSTSGAPPAPMQRVYLRSSLENLTRELSSQPEN